MKIGSLVLAEEGTIVGIIVPKPADARTFLYHEAAEYTWMMILMVRGLDDGDTFIGNVFPWGKKQLEVLSEGG
jgi:hypothetical protein